MADDDWSDDDRAACRAPRARARGRPSPPRPTGALGREICRAIARGGGGSATDRGAAGFHDPGDGREEIVDLEYEGAGRASGAVYRPPAVAAYMGCGAAAEVGVDPYGGADDGDGDGDGGGRGDGSEPSAGGARSLEPMPPKHRYQAYT